MPSIKFNGIKKDWLKTKHGRVKAPFAPVTRNLLTVPGMPGAYLSSTNTDVLEIEQPFGIEFDSDIDYVNIKDELATWLITDEPKPLEFDDEPGRTYFAVIQNSIDDFDKFKTLGQGTLLFLCVDPFSYGKEQTKSFTSDMLTLPYKGTAPASPIFELEVKEPVTFAMIQNQLNEYMMVGKPIQEGDIPSKPYNRILVDELGSMVGWVPLTNGTVLSDGLVGGEMVTTGQGFIAKEFGTNPNGWVGPARKKSFNEELQDFAVDIAVTSRNLQGETGKLQAILLDASGSEIASMALIDGTLGRPENQAIFKVGGRTILNETGENHGAYDNETVHLNLSRRGKEYTAYVYKQTGNIRTGRVRRLYTDNISTEQRKVAQVILYIAKYKNYKGFPMSINTLIADKLYKLEDLEIPYIANKGDKIIFNHKTGDCYVNGEPIPFALGGDFFNLHKGENQLTAMPFDSFNTNIRYRPTYR